METNYDKYLFLKLLFLQEQYSIPLQKLHNLSHPKKIYLSRNTEKHSDSHLPQRYGKHVSKHGQPSLSPVCIKTISTSSYQHNYFQNVKQTGLKQLSQVYK